MGVEVRREDVARVVAGRRDQSDADPVGDTQDPRDVAPEPEHGEVDHRADPESPQSFEPCDRGLDRDVLAPLGVGRLRSSSG